MDLVRRLSKILKFLSPAVIENIIKTSDVHVHFEGHPWSFLKLAVLAYWVDLYLRIIPKNFKNFAYLDLFSGSGTTRVKETGDIFLGSALLVPYISKSKRYSKSFSVFLLFEKDDSRREALRTRLSALESSLGVKFNTKLLPDCNLLSNTSFELNYDHFLAFIDCQAPSALRWPTLERLLEAKKGDIMFVWLRINFARTLGKGEYALTTFFGDDSWRSCRDVNQLLDLFVNRLSEYRSFVDVLSIECKFPIDIIIATKKGSYIRAWYHIQEFFSSLNPRIVEDLLKTFKGESVFGGFTSLQHFS